MRKVWFGLLLLLVMLSFVLTNVNYQMMKYQLVESAKAKLLGDLQLGYQASKLAQYASAVTALL